MKTSLCSRLKLAFLLGWIGITSVACNGEPHEGYYDRDHHRWYHEHAWRDCTERDEHCR
jgi:hypothetical protein